MRIHGFEVITKNLFLVDLEQIESNIVSISLNCIGEELNLEADFWLSHELKGKSEPSLHDKNFSHFIIVNESSMSLQELKNVVMRKVDLGSKVILVNSFVHKKYWDEISHSYDSHLVLINLAMFDGYESITDIFLAM